MTQSNNNNTQVPIYVLRGKNSYWLFRVLKNQIQDHLHDVDDGAYSTRLCFWGSEWKWATERCGIELLQPRMLRVWTKCIQPQNTIVEKERENTYQTDEKDFTRNSHRETEFFFVPAITALLYTSHTKRFSLTTTTIIRHPEPTPSSSLLSHRHQTSMIRKILISNTFPENVIEQIKMINEQRAQSHRATIPLLRLCWYNE